MGEVVRAPFAAPPERRQRQERERGHNPRREQERLWKLIWANAPGIGWLRLERLEAMFGSLELAWQASEADLRHALGGSTQLRRREEASLAA